MMLMTSSAVPPASSATAVQEFRSRTGAYDLSDLSAENNLRLRMSVAEFRNAGARLVSELFMMTTELCRMRDILGNQFRAFAKSELDLEPRTVSRYLHINKVLVTHFAINGEVNMQEVNMFRQKALALLSPATDPQVVSDLREMASQGKIINHDDVLEVMSRNEEEAVAKLASTQADLTALTRELESVSQAREVERARSQRELASQAELLRREEERAKDLEGEIDRLSSQATEVRFQDKEIIPAGYATVEAAIAAKKGELDVLTSKREAAAREVEALTERQKQLKEAVEQTNAGAAQFIAMKDQADALIAQFPIALLKSLSESDPTVKAALSTLGQTMVLFGQQLAKAST